MTGPQHYLEDFQLGGWIVQPSLDQLVSDAAVVRIRPQLMDLLVCLAGRPGRTITRQELAEAIWPDQFVADSGLPRCVAELRRALGDSARQPRIVETIPKRGYRLIATVTPVAREVPVPAVPRLSLIDWATQRLSAAAMLFGSRLWRRRPARSLGPAGLQPGARAGAVRPL